MCCLKPQFNIIRHPGLRAVITFIILKHFFFLNNCLPIQCLSKILLNGTAFFKQNSANSNYNKLFSVLKKHIEINLCAQTANQLLFTSLPPAGCFPTQHHAPARGLAPRLPRGSCAKPGTMGSDLGQPGSGLPSRLFSPYRARPRAEHGQTTQPSRQNNAPSRQAKAVRRLAAAFHPQLGQIRRNSARVKGEAVIHSS